MKNVKISFPVRKRLACLYVLAGSLMLLSTTSGISQCTPQPNAIEGFVFQDVNHNGLKDPGEKGVSNVRVQAIDQIGNSLG